MKKEEKIFLTKEEALKAAQIFDYSIHCFSNPSVNMLVGATWSVEDFKKELNKAKTIEAGREICRNMKHAIVVHTDNDIYFFEHNEEELKKLLKARGVE